MPLPARAVLLATACLSLGMLGLHSVVLAGQSQETIIAATSENNDSPSISPDALHTNLESIFFGTWQAGDAFSRRLMLTNNSVFDGKPLTITNLFLDEKDEQNFSTDFKGPQQLWPGEHLAVEVTFYAKQPGKVYGNLFVTHDHGSKLIELEGWVDGVVAGTLSTPNKNALDLSARAAPAFGKSVLGGGAILKPTSLQFGPDNRLYVATLDGQIKIHTVQRNGPNQYAITATETLNHIKNIPNHNDNGSVNNSLGQRLVTGLLVTGTATNPVIYVNSSDPRIGGGASGNSTNLDTNSTILSRLTKVGDFWQKLDLVRGLPRSEENHHANGMAINQAGTKLYIAMGGNTNQGATSNNFALLPEYALSAAVLEINLTQIGNTTYDLPTLNDEDRPGLSDNNDPFGGNRGKNQAMLVPAGPVTVYAPGFRNPYDLVITQAGKMYTWDNGSNAGWGAQPLNDGPQGVCSNGVHEPGDTRFDALHLITGPGYYGGHPNPTRGNNNNTFNNSIPQSPVPFSNSVECHFRGAKGASANKHPLNDSLTTLPTSTNGLVEYTASNFNNALKGDLLAATFNNNIYRVQLNGAGTVVTSSTSLFSNVGQIPLDVTAVADDGLFPGTIWVADFAANSIFVFEPNDFQGTNTAGVCNASFGGGDADQDGFSNADEQANGTDPCSAADLPADADGDLVSDLNDNDDDNDGLGDSNDPFALDPANGAATPLGVRYDWENGSAPAPFIANLGFSGLMANGSSNYQDLFDLDQMTISGAAGVVTIDNVSNGDPIGGLNTQEYAFQFGVDVTVNSPVFRARTRIVSPFAGLTPQQHQSMGIFIGTGDQDNYIKLVVNSLGPQGGLQFAKEVGGGFSFSNVTQDAIYGADAIDLVIEVDPATQTATPYYQIINGDLVSALQTFGVGTNFPVSWLTASTRLAVGIISTSIGAPSFSATWDYIEVQSIANDGADDGTGTTLPIVSISVDAGNDQSVTLPDSVSITAALSSENLSSGTETLVNWSVISGPGNVSFANPDSLVTSASFTQVGTYVLAIGVTHGELSSSDSVIVFVGGAPDTGQGGHNNQGGDDTAGRVLPENFVAVEAENFTNNVSSGNHSWVTTFTAGSSAGSAVVTTPDTGKLATGSTGSPRLDYNVTFPSAGNYYVWVRGLGDTDSAGEGGSDSVHLGLNGVLQPSADKVDQFPASGWHWSNSTRDPTVAILNVETAGTHQLNMWMREDGLIVDRIEFTTDIAFEPAGVATLVDGAIEDSGDDESSNESSNESENGNANENTGTTGNGNADGGNDSSAADGTGDNSSPPAPINTAPVVAAGNNTNTVVNTPLGLNGNVSDDGLPSNQLNVNWVALTNASSVSIASANAADTTVTFAQPGIYTLALTADDGSLVTIDSVTVTVAALSDDSTSDDLADTPDTAGDDASAADPLPAQSPIRINAGGPQIVTNGVVWIADNPGSHGFVSTGNAHPFGQSINTSGIPSVIPEQLFQSERWDSPAGAPMQWDIPLAPGNYEVRLYFSENYGPAQKAGGRVFSVAIEGQAVINQLDVFAEVGANTALMKTFTISADANLDIDFSHITQNPAIKAIEILPVVSDPLATDEQDDIPENIVEPENTAPVVSAGVAQNVIVDESVALLGVVTDDALPVNTLTTNWNVLSGPGSVVFENSNDRSTQASFSSVGTYVLELQADDGELISSDSIVISVNAAESSDVISNPNTNDNDDGSDEVDGTDETAADNNDAINNDNTSENTTPAQSPIRINAGGPQLNVGGVVWLADNPGNHGFVSTGFVQPYGQSINTSGIPSVVPPQLFQSERWDGPAGPPMQWNIPVVPSTYEVRLYFSENYTPTQKPGGRVFSVAIEGQTVINQLDVFAEAGGNTALMKTFTVSADANLDIEFSHITENPAIKAIEILPVVTGLLPTD